MLTPTEPSPTERWFNYATALPLPYLPSRCKAFDSVIRRQLRVMQDTFRILSHDWCDILRQRKCQTESLLLREIVIVPIKNAFLLSLDWTAMTKAREMEMFTLLEIGTWLEARSERSFLIKRETVFLKLELISYRWLRGSVKTKTTPSCGTWTSAAAVHIRMLLMSY